MEQKLPQKKPRTKKQKDSYVKYLDAAAEKNGIKVLLVNKDNNNKILYRSINKAIVENNLNKNAVRKQIKINGFYEDEKYKIKKVETNYED